MPVPAAAPRLGWFVCRKTRRVCAGEPCSSASGTRGPQGPSARTSCPPWPRRSGASSSTRSPADRRAPRTQPRRRRADHRHPPRVLLAQRHGRLRHRPPVLRAQAAHRAPGLLRPARPRAACPGTRAAPSPSTTSSRTRTPRPRCRGPHGLAAGRVVRGERDRHTVAVIGDGALTGGMAWEALNNIAAEPDLPLVIVVNDNERSYAPTRWRPRRPPRDAAHDPGLRALPRLGQATLSRTPVVGGAMYETLHGVKKGIKDIVAPAGPVRGPRPEVRRPVDGHDEQAIEAALRKARAFGGPVLVHVLTQKGRGYDPAVNDEGDQFHAVGVIDPETGLPLEIAGAQLDRRVQRRDGRDRRRARGRRRDHRGDADPGRPQGVRRGVPRAHLRRRHRRAARRSPWRRACRSPGCTPSSRSTPPSSTGPSTSCSWTARSTGPASPWCSTAPASPARTAPRTTACGT